MTQINEDREIEEKDSEDVESREVRGKLPGFLCQGNTGEEKKMYVAGDAWILFSLINRQERNFFATTAKAIFRKNLHEPSCQVGFRVFVFLNNFN